MKKYGIITILAGIWFLLLPFPFESGWRWLGGYGIIKPLLPHTDGIQLEMDLSRGFYASSWYPVLLALAALGMAVLTYWLVRLVLRRRGVA